MNKTAQTKEINEEKITEEKQQTPYKNAVIISDFNCSLASAQIHMRFQNVFRHTAEELEKNGALTNLVETVNWEKPISKDRPPVVHNIYTIPHGNIDFAGYALYSTYRALGRNTRPNIFVHVTDPGEGYSADRSILVTDHGNVMIGPNNGTLGLMRVYLESRSIPYDLFPIDTVKVEALERLRVASPTYELPRTFHGRDLFAVVAGLIAGGVDPHCLAPSSKMDDEPNPTAFSQGLNHLPKNVGDEIEFTVFRDENFRSLRTNLCTSSAIIQSLIEQDAAYEVSGYPTEKLGFLKKMFSKPIRFPVMNSFSNLKAGEPFLYIGSTLSTYWDERFIELAINRENIGELMDIHKCKSYTMKLKRVQ